MNTQTKFLLVNNGHGLNFIGIDNLKIFPSEMDEKAILDVLEKEHCGVWRIFAEVNVSSEKISYRMLFNRIGEQSYIDFMIKVFGQLEVEQLI